MRYSKQKIPSHRELKNRAPHDYTIELWDNKKFPLYFDDFFLSVAFHQPILLWRCLNPKSWILFSFLLWFKTDKIVISIFWTNKKFVLLSFGKKYDTMHTNFSIDTRICLGKRHETYIQYSNFVITKLAVEIHTEDIKQQKWQFGCQFDGTRW